MNSRDRSKKGLLASLICMLLSLLLLINVLCKNSEFKLGNILSFGGLFFSGLYFFILHWKNYHKK